MAARPWPNNVTSPSSLVIKGDPLIVEGHRRVTPIASHVDISNLVIERDSIQRFVALQRTAMLLSVDRGIDCLRITKEASANPGGYI